jgi:hypothetical protein
MSDDSDIGIIPGCTCGWCGTNGYTEPRMRMYVCEFCGDKRCPHASCHAYMCSGRNDTGHVAQLPETRTDIQLIDDLCRKGWKVHFYLCGLGVVAAKAKRRGAAAIYADHPDRSKLVRTLHDKIHEQGIYQGGDDE